MGASARQATCGNFILCERQKVTARNSNHGAQWVCRNWLPEQKVSTKHPMLLPLLLLLLQPLWHMTSGQYQENHPSIHLLSITAYLELGVVGQEVQSRVMSGASSRVQKNIGKLSSEDCPVLLEENKQQHFVVGQLDAYQFIFFF